MYTYRKRYSTKYIYMSMQIYSFMYSKTLDDVIKTKAVNIKVVQLLLNSYS